ncbi:vacuolar protein sorting protein VPS18 [Acrasis kona]|uniref:Vacuolar protein sorting protein VPS18 n=1 Tax=Acrasis kona TaxID=1008807 RepID=A0AAW2ZLY8_9EUKA
MSDVDEDAINSGGSDAESVTSANSQEESKRLSVAPRKKNLLNSAFKKTLKGLGLKKKKTETYNGEFEVEDNEEDDDLVKQVTDSEVGQDGTNEEMLVNTNKKNKKRQFASTNPNTVSSGLDMNEWANLSVDWGELKRKQEEREEQRKLKLARATGSKTRVIPDESSDEDVEESDQESDSDSDSEELTQNTFASQYDELQEQFDRERIGMSKKFVCDIDRDVDSALDENFRGKHSQRIVDFCVQDGTYCISCNDGRVIIINTRTNQVRTFNVATKSTQSILRCFMSPYASHIIIVTEESNKGYQHFYINSHIIEDNKNAIKLDMISPRERITAVAWQPDWYNNLSDEEVSARSDNTYTMFVGTKPNSHIKRMRVVYDISSHAIKMEYTKQFDLQRYYIDNNKILKGFSVADIDGIEMITKGSSSMVVACTRIGLSWFYLENVTFNVASTENGQDSTIVFNWPNPSTLYPLQSLKLERDDSITSTLCITRAYFNDTTDAPDGWAWSTAQGILTGKFTMDPKQNIKNYNLIPYHQPDLGYPVSMAVSNFHIHVAYASAYHIIMQPSELGATMSKYSLLGQVVFNSSKHMRLQMMGEQFIGVRVDDQKMSKSHDLIIFIKMDTRRSTEVVNVYGNHTRDEREGFWKLYLEQALDCNVASHKEEFFEKALWLCGEFEDENTKYDSKREILSARGDYYFSCSRLVEAAESYARTKRNFDEIVIKIMDADANDLQNGLYTYLYLMLKKHKYQKDSHSNNKEEHVTKESICLCTWIMQLLIHKANMYQSQINQKINVRVPQEDYARQIDTKNNALESRRKVRAAMREFMFKNKESLSRAKHLVYHLLLGNHFKDDYSYFATLIGDYELVIQGCIATGITKTFQESSSDLRAQLIKSRNRRRATAVQYQKVDVVVNPHFDKAIKILDDFCHEKKHANIWYTYAPALINYRPREILSSFRAFPFLNAWDLIPALLKFDPDLITNAPSQQLQQQQITTFTPKDVKAGSMYTDKDDNPVVEYLNWVIDTQKNDDSTIHNLMVNLLTKKRSADRLDEFLKKESESAYFSREFALRVCIHNRKFTSCVLLYRDMNLFDNAVDMALHYNRFEDALKIVTEHVHDLYQKKKLAIKLIHYLVRGNHLDGSGDDMDDGNVEGRRRAIRLVSSDLKDVLKLDDVLVHFPPDASLAPFREHLSGILSQYKSESDAIKTSMREAVNDAQSIRADLASSKPSRDLNYDVKCAHCALPVSSIPPQANRMSLVMRGQPLFTAFPCGHHFHVHCLRQHYVNSVHRHQGLIRDQAKHAAEKAVRTEVVNMIKNKYKEKRMASTSDDEEEILMAMESREMESIRVDPSKIELIYHKYLSQSDRESLVEYDLSVKRIDDRVREFEQLHRSLNKCRVCGGSDRLSLENQLQRCIDGITQSIAKECPFDGEMMVNEICIPLVNNLDRDVMNTWSIKSSAASH